MEKLWKFIGQKVWEVDILGKKQHFKQHYANYFMISL